MKLYYVSIIFFWSTFLATSIKALHCFQPCTNIQIERESRIEKEFLATFTFSTSGGKCSQSFGVCGEKTAIGSIFGATSITTSLSHELPSNNFKELIENIKNEREDALINLEGSRSYIIHTLSYIQNYKYGLFSEIHIPLVRIKQSSLTPTLVHTTNSSNVKDFIREFNPIMESLNIHNTPLKESSLGSIYVGGGWSINDENFEKIDFIDYTVRLGYTFSKPFSAEIINLSPIWYDHKTFHANMSTCLGIYDWITLGWYGKIIYFSSTEKNLPIVADKRLEGVSFFSKTFLTEKPGMICTLGTYCKADHFALGLSCYFGYEYSHQNHSYISNIQGNADINKHECFKEREIHYFIAGIEYDWANVRHPHAPLVRFYYQKPLSGKRTLIIDSFYGSLGIDICWNF